MPSDAHPTPPSPRLPYDVLYLIAEQSVIPVESEWEWAYWTAKSWSLVCREFRDLGQRALWKTVTLPHRRIEEGREDESMARLLRSVRSLCWDEGYRPESRRVEPRFSQSVETLFVLLETLTGLMSIHFNNFPGSWTDWEDIFATIPSSPSASTITTLSIVGQFHARQKSPLFTESTFIPFLASLPALSSLYFDPTLLSPPHSPVTGFTNSLSLTSIALDVSGRDEHPETFTPSEPRHALSVAINPATLRHVTVLEKVSHNVWINWLSSPSFTSLTSLSIVVWPRCSPYSFKDLSPLLSFHRQLRRLEIRDQSDYGHTRYSEAETTPHLLPLFMSLPPSLEVFFFFTTVPLPVDDVLAPYFDEGPSSNLVLFEYQQEPYSQAHRVVRDEAGEIEVVRLRFSLPASSRLPSRGIADITISTELLLSARRSIPLAPTFDDHGRRPTDVAIFEGATGGV
jgi:hypothetical protein